MTPQQRLLGQSALQAFRSDIVPGAPEPTSEDQVAILVATLLRQSLSVDDETTLSRMRDEAILIARKSLGEQRLNEGCTYDDHPSKSNTDVIRLLAQRSSHAGRVSLSQHLLESAAAMETDPIECGRILTDRAIGSRKQGHLDLAFAQYQMLLSNARALRSGELLAKAHYGLAAFAETRGNFAEYRTRVRSLIRIARAHRLKKLAAAGHAALGTTYSLAGRYGDAVASYWKAIQLTGQKGQIANTALGNLGQTLLISGRPAEARKVATLVIQQANSPNVLIPSLGTFAVASAQLGDQDGVQWAANRIDAFAAGTGHVREMAEASMECSAALGAIGETKRAAVVKRRAQALAMQYGFYSLTFEEAMVSVQHVANPQLLGVAAEKAAAAIEEMEVPRIPELSAALPV